MTDLRLTEIWIYPIKSLGGIRLKSSRVLEKGLRFDRRWMLLDENGIFMTQRTWPEMSLFKLSLEGEFLELRYGSELFRLAVHGPVKGSPIQAKVFDDAVSVFEASTECSDWISARLLSKCTLVSFPEENKRPVDPDYQVNAEQVSLADAFPFLIIGEASLADLNSRMEIPLPMNRFRPNLVFSGGSAFEEDNWRDFTIGNNRFVGVKPCARCPIPTVNQDTAEKGKEPLVTLAAYRKRNNKVYFGQNVIAVDHGEIFEGDLIVLEASQQLAKGN